MCKSLVKRVPLCRTATISIIIGFQAISQTVNGIFRNRDFICCINHLQVLRPQRKVAIQTIPLACLMDDMRRYNARAIDLLAGIDLKSSITSYLTYKYHS